MGIGNFMRINNSLISAMNRLALSMATPEMRAREQGIKLYEELSGTKYKSAPLSDFFVLILSSDRIKAKHRAFFSYLLQPEIRATQAFQPEWEKFLFEKDVFYQKGTDPQNGSSYNSLYSVSLFERMAKSFFHLPEGEELVTHLAVVTGACRVPQFSVQRMLKHWSENEEQDKIDDFLVEVVKDLEKQPLHAGVSIDRYNYLPLESRVKLYAQLSPERLATTFYENFDKKYGSNWLSDAMLKHAGLALPEEELLPIFRRVIDAGLIQKLFQGPDAPLRNAYAQALFNGHFKLAEYIREEAEARDVDVLKTPYDVNEVLFSLSFQNEDRGHELAREYLGSLPAHKIPHDFGKAVRLTGTAAEADNVLFNELYVSRLSVATLMEEFRDGTTWRDFLEKKLGQERSSRCCEIIDERIRQYKLHRWTLGLLGSDGTEAPFLQRPLKLAHNCAAETEKAYPEGVIDGLDLKKGGFRSDFYLLDASQIYQQDTLRDPFAAMVDHEDISTDLWVGCRIAVPYNGDEKVADQRSAPADIQSGKHDIEDFITQKYKVIEVKIPVAYAEDGRLVADRESGRRSMFIGDAEYDQQVLPVRNISGSLFRVMAYANPGFSNDPAFNPYGALERVDETSEEMSAIVAQVGLKPFGVALAHYIDVPHIEKFAAGHNPAKEEICIRDGHDFVMPSYEPGEADCLSVYLQKGENASSSEQGGLVGGLSIAPSI